MPVPPSGAITHLIRREEARIRRCRIGCSLRAMQFLHLARTVECSCSPVGEPGLGSPPYKNLDICGHPRRGASPDAVSLRLAAGRPILVHTFLVNVKKLRTPKPWRLENRNDRAPEDPASLSHAPRSRHCHRVRPNFICKHEHSYLNQERRPSRLPCTRAASARAVRCRGG